MLKTFNFLDSSSFIEIPFSFSFSFSSIDEYFVIGIVTTFYPTFFCDTVIDLLLKLYELEPRFIPPLFPHSDRTSLPYFSSFSFDTDIVPALNLYCDSTTGFFKFVLLNIRLPKLSYLYFYLCCSYIISLNYLLSLVFSLSFFKEVFLFRYRVEVSVYCGWYILLIGVRYRS